jgi:hypothetical protein
MPSSNALQGLVRGPKLRAADVAVRGIGYLYELDACLRRKINMERDHEQGNKQLRKHFFLFMQEDVLRGA